MTTANENLVTPTIARHVLSHFGEKDGMRPGGFFLAFYELAGRADSGNLAKLELGFPAEIAAFRMASYELDGIRKLQAIANSEVTA